MTGQVGEVQPGEGVFGVAVGVVLQVRRRLDVVGEQVEPLAGLAGADCSAASAGWGMSASMVAAWWVSSSTR